jgi:hypothetical protein
LPTPKEILAQNISQSETSTGYIDTMDLFNVRRYGAVPNTVDSQGLAIQSCINACVSAGSKVVYFPTGVYMTTALSSNVDDVYLIGDNASFSSNGSTYTITQAFETTSIPALYADASSQATRISDLESTVANIDTRLGVIESTVANIDTRLGVIESTVASHTTSISALYEATSSNSGRIGVLESTVANLSSRLGVVEGINKLTTFGDLLYYSSNNEYDRLPIGSSDQLLTVDAGQLKWKDPTAVDVSEVELLTVFLS